MIQTVAGAGPDYTVIPVQGSGTFAIEAALTTFLKPDDKVLVCVNGVYGELVLKILARHGLGYAVVRRPVGEPIPVDEVEARLRADPSITHLYFVHLETTSGILNPLQQLTALAHRRGVVTMVEFDERLRGDRDRRPLHAVRRHARVGQQMHRSTARHRLRDRPAQPADPRRHGGQDLFAGPARPVARLREHGRDGAARRRRTSPRRCTRRCGRYCGRASPGVGNDTRRSARIWCAA